MQLKLGLKLWASKEAHNDHFYDKKTLDVEGISMEWTKNTFRFYLDNPYWWESQAWVVMEVKVMWTVIV
jgi:hypothetical protein